MVTVGMMHGGMGLWVGLWSLLALALLVLAVVGTVWLIRNLGGSSGGAASGSRGSAVDELDRRYARGEIDREEFMRAREDLSKR
ncbi:MAG: SHOCT domain-containing protein [Egibacteraceae bacterium]